ncbi:MAG TPA: hypothetical protein HA362_01415 [Nanoarchaeota archaeon]|nr:hypothetical protein [Nanoarchaeota archaeon]
MKRKYLALVFIIAILLLSTIAAAGFWQDITGGVISLSKFFKTKTTQQTIPPAEKAVTIECKAYIDGKCATESQPKLNMNLPKSAKAYTLESQKAKTVSGKAVKVSKTEKTITHNVMIGTQTKEVKVPVVNVCINNKCKEYGIDETLEIAGVVYDMALVKEKITLLPKGAQIIPPHEEDISKIELPPLKPMIQPKIKVVTPSLIPMPQPHIFKIGVIVDRDTIPYTQATRAEIEEAIALANDMLRIRNVNIQFLLQDIQNVNMGGYDTYMGEGWSVSGYIDDYYMGHIVSPPNGVAIFREDSVASLYGGYAVVSSNLIDYGFCNNFQSPALGNSYIYGGVHDWDHMYASCGYDSNLDSSNGYDGNHISAVSIDGECINSPGTPCIIHNGYYMCNNTDFENEEYARQRLNFIASNLIHEFLHSFSETLSHYCTVDCPSSCELAQDYAGMCPFVWDNFKNSWHSCGNIAYGENCAPDVDRCLEGTICEAWSAGNYRCSCLTDTACPYGRTCYEKRCKIPTGGECDIRRADLCITGHCTLTAGQRFKGTCTI